MQEIIPGSHVDSAVKLGNILLYAMASARFVLYVSSEIGVGATVGTVVGGLAIAMVVLGLTAVKLLMSITIIVVGFSGVAMPVFVGVDTRVFVGTGGRKSVFVAAVVGTIVSGTLVGSTTFEVSADDIGSVVLDNSRDSGGAGSISMKPVRLLTAVNC